MLHKTSSSEATWQEEELSAAALPDKRLPVDWDRKIVLHGSTSCEFPLESCSRKIMS
ncbi:MULTISPECIES: hypothetical protein [unclassified Mesorhizobium]|uniref:hypothetical protein n=1 Tax=unclassified Mesorhizobium TaxID=325217 RepID=UPI001679B455|nr:MULTISPECIES: hypothetical protein [unclassified Mesorhizobium]